MTTTRNRTHSAKDDPRTVGGAAFHPGHEPVPAYAHHVSVILLAAFALSATYTIYLTAVGTADPNFGAAAPATWLFYAVGFGLARVARSTRSRAHWTLAIALAALLAVALFVYPSTFTAAQQTTFGWFENDVYTGLLMLALYLTVTQSLIPAAAPRLLRASYR